jgi:hypothetical protein
MMNALKNEIGELEKQADRLEHWLFGSILVVVVGLIAEYVPDLLGSTARIANAVRKIGEFLVIVGVVGELVIHSRASRYETRIRKLNDEIFTDSERRIAELNARAEQDRLARVQLERRYAARRISGPMYEALCKVLPRYSGKRVDIFLLDRHVTEVDMLGRMLHIIFSNCGWDSRLWFSRGDKMTDIGLHSGLRAKWL